MPSHFPYIKIIFIGLLLALTPLILLGDKTAVTIFYRRWLQSVLRRPPPTSAQSRHTSSSSQKALFSSNNTMTRTPVYFLSHGGMLANPGKVIYEERELIITTMLRSEHHGRNATSCVREVARNWSRDHSESQAQSCSCLFCTRKSIVVEIMVRTS